MADEVSARGVSRTRASIVATWLVLVALVVLAARAAHRSYADSAYREGLGYTEFPAEDVPGRLEAYEEALRRAPDTFLYLLRSGQIRLSRVAGANAAKSGDASAELDVARQRLTRAATVHPLDARARISIAQVFLLDGDAVGALREARVALALGPRHPTVQVAAVRLGIDAWRRSGDPEALGLALDAGALRASWTAIHGPAQAGNPLRFVGAALRARSDDVLGDLLEAAGSRSDRLSVAIEWTARARPDVARILESRRRRVTKSGRVE